MREYIRQGKTSTVIDQFTRNLILSVPHTRFSELNAIFAFVRDDIRYVPDTIGVERLCTAEQTLSSATGDCDDKVVLLLSMLENIGFKTRVHAVGFERANEFTHVVGDVQFGKNWLTLDPCVAGVPPGWRPPGAVTHMVRH